MDTLHNSVPFIGIVGGVGPMAGLDLHRKIMEETCAKSDQEHLSVVLALFSASILDRTEYLLGRVAENPGKDIGRIALQLVERGARVVAVPCNTAHSLLIWECVQNEMGEKAKRLMSMVEVCAAYLANATSHAQQIGLLSTQGTYHSGVYEKALSKAGFRVLTPDRQGKEQVHASIYHPSYGIKTRAKVSDPSRTILHSQAENLINKGAKAILLACSEIPLTLPMPTLGGVPLIDPNRLLATALIDRVAPERLKSATLHT